ncbi:hypothetical protein HNR62_001062 [Oceanisphaera litoralis]|uniref:hypothetical protein n=1 Tax=Oceanisphaera litoralis TaxID=225144 RepID=UPI00195CAC81|nr:hypothetical protein [Oceanisphaera litoralis]MBM7455202.1 hypothetical protein [Oceanisphaera litoralis]
MKKPAAFEGSRVSSNQPQGMIDMSNVNKRTTRKPVLLNCRYITWAELNAIFVRRKAQLQAAS